MEALLKKALLQCFDIVDVLVIERIKCEGGRQRMQRRAWQGMLIEAVQVNMGRSG